MTTRHERAEPSAELRDRAREAGLRREYGGTWGAVHHGYAVGHPLITGVDDDWTFWTPSEGAVRCGSEALELALLWRDAVVLS